MDQIRLGLVKLDQIRLVRLGSIRFFLRRTVLRRKVPRRKILEPLRLLGTSCNSHAINEALHDQFNLNIKTSIAKLKILEKTEKDYVNLKIEFFLSITKMIEITNINE